MYNVRGIWPVSCRLGLGLGVDIERKVSQRDKDTDPIDIKISRIERKYGSMV